MFHKNSLNCNLISTKKLKVGISLKSKLNRDNIVQSTFESFQTFVAQTQIFYY